MPHHSTIHVPTYKGSKWIRPTLPKATKAWHLGKPDIKKAFPNQLKKYVRYSTRHSPWVWPVKPIYFICDPHADAEAFVASLVSSGGIKKIAGDLLAFKLTKAGKKALFIIGGDCLDKGPGNFDLLSAVRKLLKLKPDTLILAGNHDIRLLMGLYTLDLKRDPLTEHFFVRMGAKVVPLLREVYDIYLKDKKHPLKHVPDKKKCKKLLFPSAHWLEEFPDIARQGLSDAAIKREMSRIKHKLSRFEDTCARAGLSLRMVYAAAYKCKQLFLKPKGEFAWFYKRMQLVHREKSFLFTHAGLDDRVARIIEKKGIKYLNKQFKKQLNKNLFKFYYGPLANMIRTKYREVNMPLTHQGVNKIHRQGIHAIVHGHSNRMDGQRLMLRTGLLHIESDTTLDRNSRKKEGLHGYGAAATIIDPGGQVLGVSSDYPAIKVFQPEKYI